MSKPSLLERGAISIARFVAGPDRRHWLDAIEAELGELESGRLDWALGSLVAALKDRFARDWALGLSLVALPFAAVVSIAISSPLLAALAHATGLSALQLMPVMSLSPLPFALLLGLVRPHYSALLKGLLGFTVYQLGPAIGFSLLFGQYVYVRWEANLSHYGLFPPAGFVSTGALWCAGTWLSARWARARRLAP